MIKSSAHSKDEIANGEIKNTEAQIKGKITFENYEWNAGTNEMIGTNPIDSNLFFNKIQTLNEVCSTGKRFYKKLQNKLKEQHLKYRRDLEERNDTPQFTTLGRDTNSKSFDNSFINNFLSKTIFEDKLVQEDVLEIAKKYCEKYGFPIVDESNFDSVDDNPKLEYYYFEVQPFIALSILIYIIFEVQNSLKKILDLTSSKKIENQTIQNIFGSENFYQIDEYLDNIYKFIWLFDIDLNDKYKLSLVEISEKLINIIDRIELSSTYLKYRTENGFDSKYKKFYILEIHSNIMSIAWERLKLEMFPYSNGIAKKCKSCGRVFEADSNATNYCSEECKSENKKINSNNSYNKLKNLHIKLRNLYNTVDKSLFSSLDKEIQENINKYASLDISSLKKEKDENKIKNLEKYIQILDKFDKNKN